MPNQQLYGAFKDRIRKLESNKNFDKTAIESRLGQEQSQVKDLFSVRNKAAHASLDGDEREVNFEDYQKLHTFLQKMNFLLILYPLILN